ncbi:hypothetical protein PoB_000672900 [Plakobranchus ocellatus]|uniref:Uncharacterized protein n=1 Tax=Plakobranchus ocellatus TaxID=259542 RepID=A0AAV3YD86_9GAST|nr:hypothetical protein PoB_000672900 [Plakobranchus ocellatus]
MTHLDAPSEKTFQASLFKRYITNDTASNETPTSNSYVPAASLAVVKDGDEDSGHDDCGCEVLPEVGGWGSKETMKEVR